MSVFGRWCWTFWSRHLTTMANRDSRKVCFIIVIVVLNIYRPIRCKIRSAMLGLHCKMFTAGRSQRGSRSKGPTYEKAEVTFGRLCLQAVCVQSHCKLPDRVCWWRWENGGALLAIALPTWVKISRAEDFTISEFTADRHGAEDWVAVAQWSTG